MPLLPPPPDEDPVQQLEVQYFRCTELMFDKFDRLYQKIVDGEVVNNKEINDFQCYGKLWLATLYVAAEAFKEDKALKRHFDTYKDECPACSIHWGCIRHQIGQLGDELKKYRNGTFHFQVTMEKHRVFLEYAGARRPTAWAKDLHREMQMFFAAYRIEGTALWMTRQIRTEQGE